MHNSQQFMAKRVPALVKHQLLVWARESAGISPSEAAESLKLELDTLVDWEAGIEGPSVSQLRAMSSLYRRPLSVFYLQEVPLRFKPLADFRRTGDGDFSPELTQEIRFAIEHRETAKELLADLGDAPKRLPRELAADMSAEEAGEAIRRVLDFDAGRTNRFGADREGRSALNAWRNSIEAAGALVFQTTRVSQKEASGFAIADDDLPVIVVNRKDAPTRRLFSLLHEFAHVLIRESGVSDLDVDLTSKSTKKIEVFCNRAAAAALMPKAVLLGDPLVRSNEGDETWSDADLFAIARKFGVSREALLVRLITLGRTTWPFYQAKRQQYAKEYERLKAEKQQPVEMARNMAQETLSNLGRSFIDLVMGNYFQDRLTLGEVSRVLDLRVRHVEPLQRLLAKPT